MGAVPYGNASEIDVFFAGKKPGDRVIKAELLSLPSLEGLSMSQKRRFISYFEGTGDLVPVDGGGFCYKQPPTSKPKYETPIKELTDQEPTSRTPDIAETVPHRTSFEEDVSEFHLPASLREPARVLATESPDYTLISGKIDPKTAYEFFDPNPTIFRGYVVSEAGWNDGLGKSQSTGVEVLLPGGYTRFGLVSPRHGGLFFRSKEGTTLQSIAGKMNKGEFVLVRHVGEFTGKSGKPTWLFEPLLYLTADDNARLNGESIRTVVEPGRILHLPIIEPGKMRDGVLNGVGYVPEGYDIAPVYVDGAGNKVWTVVPEVGARKILKEVKSRSGVTIGTHVFYIGELPMTADERAKRQLRKAETLIEVKRRHVDSFEIGEAIAGETDSRGRVTEPSMEKAYVMALGTIRPAREAGMEHEALGRVNGMRGIMSMAATRKHMDEREQDIIRGLHREGSDAHKKLMADWPSIMEACVKQEEAAGGFAKYWWDTKTSEQKKEAFITRLRDSGPFYFYCDWGLFAGDVIKLLTGKNGFGEYLAAAYSAFSFAESRISSSYNWRQRFSMDGFLSASGQIIDEEEFWRTARASFKGIDVARVWEAIKEELAETHEETTRFVISSRMMKPYIEYFAQKVS